MFYSGLIKVYCRDITINRFKMDDIEICHCNEVMKNEIVKAIREKHLKTVEEVQEATQAGTVCGGCIPDIEEILSEINK
jgi:NAD(P)H-nitrite reductase large subunit